ncbi:MAG TPA: histidine kinase [Thermoanaerobaculia bacterium]
MSRFSSRELALIFLFWTALATLSSINWLVDPRGPGIRLGRTGPIAMTFVEAFTWAVLTPLIFWIVTRMPSSGSLWIRVPVLILIGVAVAIGVYVFLDFVRTLVFETPTRRGGAPVFAPMRGIARFRFANHLLVYSGVLVAGYARLFFLRDRERQTEAVELRAQLSDARLSALRMQLNPHFLFNTLHAISALVERDPSGVRKVIARLSELLRHTIDSKAADMVPLRDELAFLRRYIEIMEIRFQGRLRVTMNVADDTLGALVPNLILQPIVENALEHGASRALGEGQLTIEAHRDAARLVMTVCDNGPGLGENPETGVGVANTRARLAQLYGDAGTLTLAPGPNAGVLATITLPLREERNA